MHALVKLIEHRYLLQKAQHSLPAVRCTTQHVSAMLGAIVNSKITTKKKHKNAENMALNTKGHFFAV